MRVNFNGGGGGVTRFSDNLQRVTSLGSAWSVGFSDPSQANFFQPTITETITGLLLKNNTGGGSAVSMLLVPTVLGAIAGKTQFAECVFVDFNINFPSAGPCVASQGDPLSGSPNGYFANIQPPNNFLQVRVCNVGQRLVQDNIGTSVAAGVTVRLNVTFGSASNSIDVFVNGVKQIATIVDNNAARPIASAGGIPGIFWKGCAAGSQIRFASFRSGLGTGS